MKEGKETFGEVGTTMENGPKRISTLPLNTPEKEEQNLFETSDKLTKTLFGENQYKYKLVLNEKFPETLYKERNFNISVKLVDISTGK